MPRRLRAAAAGPGRAGVDALHAKSLSIGSQKTQSIVYQAENWSNESQNIDVNCFQAMYPVLHTLPVERRGACAQLPPEQGALAWVHYMRWARRADGLAASRKLFIRSRKWPACSWQARTAALCFMAACPDSCNPVRATMLRVVWQRCSPGCDVILSTGTTSGGRFWSEIRFALSISVPSPCMTLHEACVTLRVHNTLAWWCAARCTRQRR